MKKPKVLYSNMVNLSGLYSNKPVRCKPEKDSDDDYYWDSSGNFDCHLTWVEGTIFLNRGVQFTSEDKEKVQIWTDGAKAVMKQLNDWSKV